MGILWICIIGVILGLIFIAIYCSVWYTEWFWVIGLTSALLSGMILAIIILLLLFKPLDYSRFVVNYETIKEISTSEKDIRDTNYTQKIIEINTEIKTNRKFINNEWIGILYNKDIAELELLNK